MDGDEAQLPVVMGVFGTTLDQDELIKTLSGEYKNPFVPFTGFTSKIKNDGAYIVNESYTVDTLDTSADNIFFETQGDSILDFSETNPFGEVT